MYYATKIRYTRSVCSISPTIFIFPYCSDYGHSTAPELITKHWTWTRTVQPKIFEMRSWNYRKKFATPTNLTHWLNVKLIDVSFSIRIIRIRVKIVNKMQRDFGLSLKRTRYWARWNPGLFMIRCWLKTVNRMLHTIIRSKWKRNTFDWYTEQRSIRTLLSLSLSQAIGSVRFEFIILWNVRIEASLERKNCHVLYDIHGGWCYCSGPCYSVII